MYQQYIEVIERLNPELGELIGQLLQDRTTHDQAKELACDLANYIQSDPKQKPGLIEKAANTAGRLLVLAQTYEKFKPAAKAIYQLVKGFALNHGVDLHGIDLP